MPDMHSLKEERINLLRGSFCDWLDLRQICYDRMEWQRKAADSMAARKLRKGSTPPSGHLLVTHLHPGPTSQQHILLMCY